MNVKRAIYISAGSLAALVVIAMLVTASIWPLLNEVETGITAEYPEVQPHYYSTQPARIYDEVLVAVEQMERWEIIDRRPEVHEVDARRHTAVPGMTADTTIRIESLTEFVTQVHVRSSGGLGKADFGQNARVIREFLSELDERLGAVKFEPRREHEEDEDSGNEPLSSGGEAS